MKALSAVLVVLLSSLLSGCVPVPLPHREWLSPRFHGTVVDAGSGRPLKGVKVTLRDYGYAEKEIGSVLVYSDERGDYSVLATRSALWTPIWLGPAEGVMSGTVTFECSCYEAFEEKKSMFGSAYARPDFEVNVRLKAKRPNQPPEPTVMSVTPRAGARIAPALTVAHL